MGVSKGEMEMLSEQVERKCGKKAKKKGELEQGYGYG